MALTESTYTTTVDAAGTAIVSFKVSNGLETWTVTQVSVDMPDAPSGAYCELRKNTYAVTPIIPTMDTAAGDPPVIVRPSDELTVEWRQCTPGDLGKVIFFYDDGRPD